MPTNSFYGLDMINNWLQQQQILSPEELITEMQPLSGGNMNLVHRLRSNQSRTWVLKQAFPFVHKYPQVPAPADRLSIEAEFYQLCAQDSLLRAYLPRILGFDPAHRLLLLEDLGQAADYGFLYQQTGLLGADTMADLLEFLRLLHKLPLPAAKLSNREMRALNHEYIFLQPFRYDSGFDLDVVTEGLQPIAVVYQQDKALLERIASLGQAYLADGECLLHGDFYPCSWLHTAQGLKIIDVEFAFCGAAAFDYGVLYAHLLLGGQSQLLGQLEAHCELLAVDKNELQSYAGVEIFRRILGLAQLPLSLDLEAKKSLLQQAYHLLMGAA